MRPHQTLSDQAASEAGRVVELTDPARGSVVNLQLQLLRLARNEDCRDETARAEAIQAVEAIEAEAERIHRRLITTRPLNARPAVFGLHMLSAIGRR